ncbi:MAG: ABC transporter substrate-binding protein, partial [Acetobacteraceae bacterium]
MIGRRSILAGGAAAAAATLAPRARAAATPGVTAHRIKIGNTNPYSGPASSYGAIGHTLSAFFKMANDQGGVAGHQIDFISYDDGYLPPRTVEDVRRLVEQDQVDFMFQTLGTPTCSAIVRYLNHQKVPMLFVATGASKWGHYKEYPWTIGFQPTYRTEAQIYAKYALQQKPGGKIGVLYQNDDFGKDYLSGLHDVLGKDWSKHVIKALSYEVTDPTVDSQMTELQASGADVFVCVTAPKQAAQAIRKAGELTWKPMFFMTNVSISAGSVMKPAGAQNGVGIITSGYLKDATEAAFKNDAGMNQWRAFMTKYMPHADLSDNNFVYGYTAATAMRHVLEACKGDFSRASVMKQALNIKPMEIGTLLPGITVSDTPTNRYPIRAMQLQKWDGANWVRFGGII